MTLWPYLNLNFELALLPLINNHMNTIASMKRKQQSQISLFEILGAQYR
jgi:hypothetical protein